MSCSHLARLVRAYLQRPGAHPGERSPDDAFTVLSPVDGHCVAVDWCPADDTALIYAHPSQGHASADIAPGAGVDEGREMLHDLGGDDLGQWWLHEDLNTGCTTLALRAPVAAWTPDDFSRAFDAFCHRLASMSASDADSLDEAPVSGQPAAFEATRPTPDLVLSQRA